MTAVEKPVVGAFLKPRKKGWRVAGKRCKRATNRKKRFLAERHICTNRRTAPYRRRERGRERGSVERERYESVDT